MGETRITEFIRERERKKKEGKTRSPPSLSPHRHISPAAMASAAPRSRLTPPTPAMHPHRKRARSPRPRPAGALLVLRKRRAARPPPPLAEPCRGLAWSRLSAAPRAAVRGALPEVGPCGGSLDLRRRYYAGCIVGEILLPLLTICLCQCLSEDCTFASFFFLFASFARVNSEKSVDPASASMKLRPNQCQFHP